MESSPQAMAESAPSEPLILRILMTEENNTIALEPCPEQSAAESRPATLQIGIVANYQDSEETRVLLTPEACGMLTSAGIAVCMETGAGIDIDFSDEKYAEYGVTVADRETALRQNIVVSYAPLRAADILKMQKGAALLCVMDSSLFQPDSIKALLDHRITLGCFDNMYSHNDEPVFANIIDEINGRAAIMYAQDHLSYLGGGKGVLLAGVAGINPCEVLIVGDGMDVYSASLAAINSGATVTLINNDVSTLQTARQFCGERLVTLAMHPRVLFNKVKTADVIIIGSTTRPFEMPRNLAAAMKETVYMLDLKQTQPSVSVPRTVAMGLSNALVNFFNEAAIKEGITGMIATTEGVQRGIVTYDGKLVDKLVASYLNLPCVDISVMLSSHSN